ncbi:MAG: hypothetical protein A4E32_01286 [Methanomassiliicoccales archaeon PtaU1.Bin124]|nr:MAG: hypothetical protein A4E32_01286 [Methanomassiliicoccales archaeon PtaU1.Bin124]
MSKGSKIAIVALAVIVIIVAAVALTGFGRVNTPESSIRSFFSEFDKGNYQSAMKYTTAALANTTFQEWYIVELEAQETNASVGVASVQDVTASISDSTRTVIQDGLDSLAYGFNVTFDSWVVLSVNITESYSWSKVQYISDTYLIMVHCNGNWLLEPTSFQNEIDGWVVGWST